MLRIALTLLTFAVAAPAVAAQSQLPAAELLKDLRFRSVGPTRGGRVTAVAGVAESPFTFYMGSTGGGVWKSRDAGTTWNNVSDGFFGGSVGAVAVAPSDSNVVYVGTGSACPRGNISPGVGMYRSTDGGRSWQAIGLEETGMIARIVVHPADPDLVYVAALGNPFGPNEQRGVFRSRDGGSSWEKVLFLSSETGAVDLAMDPSNPRILLAGMWRVERKPWTLIDGGPEGGVYRSTDAGDNWKRLKGGLPESGQLGRVGIAIAPTNPDRIWVILEANDEEKGGLYRSDDGGASFSRINRDHDLRGRAWYYNHVFADPRSDNIVYILNAPFWRSVDGGASFERVTTPHGDNHALWINPEHPDIWITGNDGGAAVTLSNGASWSTQFNQPTAEFYRVTVDRQFPYRLYGSQQDNSTISVPSRRFRTSSPQQHWIEVGGGESGHVAVDPTTPGVVYSGNYIGQITRRDAGRGHTRNVTAYPQMHDGLGAKDIRFRFQWNAPIRISPHDPTILYHTSQYVHRSRDGGQSWEVISPDLTTNNLAWQEIPGGPVQHDHTGVEMYTTVFAFEESPHTAGVLWAGTDDGRLHVSRNAGGDWQEVTPEQLPAGATINTIEISPHAEDRIFVTAYRYRENDRRPYVFKSDDGGSSWTLLTDGANGIPADHWVRVVREDPVRRGLLYAGTEFGLYLSTDGGAHWEPFQQNLPMTPVTDIQVHQGDLVVATQGRAFWILDDLSPLRQLTKDIGAADGHLFKPRAGVRARFGGRGSAGSPRARPQGAAIDYWLGEARDSVTLEVLEADGALIRSLSRGGPPARRGSRRRERALDASAGLHRVYWDLRYPGAETVEGAQFSLSDPSNGPLAAPGTYRVRLTVGDRSFEQPLEVLADPRWTAGTDDLKAQHELAIQIRDQLTETHAAIGRLRDIREQLAAYRERLDEDSALAGDAESISEQLRAVEAELIQWRSEGGQDPINYPPRLDDQLSYLMSVVDGQDARPTEGSYQRFEDLKRLVAPHLEALRQLEEGPLAEFNRALTEADLAGIRP